MKKQTFLITGSSGFLGSHLTHVLRQQGHTVWELSSRPNTEKSKIKFKLGEKLLFPSDVETSKTLIHCAYDFNDTSDPNININLTGSSILFNEATQSGIDRIVFISSMSAHEGAKSNYGRIKFLIEQEVRKHPKHLIIRPGFILGPGGICARLIDQIRKLPTLPIFFAHSPIQPIDVENLLAGVTASLNSDFTGELNLACSPALETKEFYARFCQLLKKQYRPLILPGNLGLATLKLLETAHIPLPLKSDNLLGLKYAKIWDTEESWNRLAMPCPTPDTCFDAFSENLKS